MRRKREFFTNVFQPYMQTTLPLELIDSRNLAAEFYYSKMGEPNFRIFLFPIPKSGESGQVGLFWRAHFGVVRNPISTFPLAVH